MISKNVGYALLGGAVLGGLALLLRKGSSSKPLVGPGDRVVLIGDSLGVGLRKPLGALAEAAGIPFAGQACGGTMIFQWVKEQTAYPSHDTSVAKRCAFGLAYIREVKPTVVLISLGTNDAHASVDQIAKEQADVQTLIAAIQDMGARPVWIDPPRLVAAPHVPEMLQIIYSGAAENIPHFRSDELVIPMGGDHIHPTGAGYAAWADALWQWLTR